MLSLRLLGGMTCEGSPAAVQISQQRKSIALLAVIAMAPNGGITREKLLGYFWPDAPEEKGKNALRQRLFSLRREIGVSDLILGTQELRLNPERIVVDVWAFRDACSRGDADEVARLYTGPFLDGAYFSELPELERWIEEVRSTLQQEARTAMRLAATRATEAADHARAATYWQLASVLDPASAEVLIELLRAQVRAGDTPAAVQRFRQYRALMQSEYDLPPDPRVVALVTSWQTVARENPLTASSIDAAEPVRPTEVADWSNTTLNPTPTPTRNWLRWLMFPAAALGALFFAQRGTPAAGDDDDTIRILVAAYDGDTLVAGSSSLAGVLQREVVRSLARESTAKILDARFVLSASQQQSGLAAAARELGARFVIKGTVELTSDTVVVKHEIMDGRSGALVAVLPSVRRARSERDSLVRDAANRLAGALAVLQDPLYTNSTGPQADPPRVDAYREYMTGIGLASLNDFPGATRYFLQAYSLDSTFAPAALWALEGNPPDEVRTRLTAALTARRRDLTPIDRARLDFRTAYDARHLGEAFVAAREMARLAPTSNHALHTLAFMALESRHFEEAADIMRTVNPEQVRSLHWASFFELGSTVLELSGDLSGALQFAQASTRLLPNPLTCSNVLQLHVAAGQVRRALQGVNRCVLLASRDTIRARLDVHHNLARALAVHGYQAEADSLSRQSVRIAEASASTQKLSRARLAEIYALGGQHSASVQLYAQQLDADPNALVPAQAALAAIAALYAGDSTRYRQFADIVYQSPRPRPRHLYTAHIAIAAGKPDSALAALARFERAGGLVVRQLHGEPRFRSLRHRPEWLALFSPISESTQTDRPPAP